MDFGFGVAIALRMVDNSKQIFHEYPGPEKLLGAILMRVVVSIRPHKEDPVAVTLKEALSLGDESLPDWLTSQG